MKYITKLAVASIVGGLIASAAAAVPLTWTLEDVEFGNGDTATGSFVYDADAMAWGTIDITVNSGATMASMDTLAGNIPGVVFNLFGPGDVSLGDRFLQLVFAQTLTNAGGTIAATGFNPDFLSSSFVSTCDNNVQASSCGLVGNFTAIGGKVTASPVPLPAGAVLLFSGLVGFAAMRRKAV